MPSDKVEAALIASMQFFEQRDLMNAAIHLTATRWSPVTTLVKEGMEFYYENQNEPRLGCATTAQLLEELSSRFQVHLGNDDIIKLVEYIKGQLGDKDLSYRTIDS